MDLEVIYSAALERQAIVAQQRPPEPPPVIVAQPREKTLRVWSTRGRVMELLRVEGWMKVADVAHALGLSYIQAVNALSSLANEGKVVRRYDQWKGERVVGVQQYRVK